MVEAATDELCEKYVDQVIDVMKSEGLDHSIDRRNKKESNEKRVLS